ncbi:MAG: carbohydrate-binding module family 20 domain-containing protein, partial [Bacteroidota bacterium]
FQPGSGDRVRVPGDFNGWSTSADTLLDADGDSIYTKVKSLPTGAINYKFYKTLRGGIDWEGDPNRTYTVVAGTQNIPPVYFDRDSVYTPPVAAPVTFRVNMRVKLLEGGFQPQNGDIVRVAGSFNGWGGSTDTLRDVSPTDSIYQKTININEGTAIQYKFLKTLRGGSDWEGGSNREYTVPTGGGTLPAVYFDYDSVVNVPITANIVWRVDMKALQNIGWFAPASGDSVQVRGQFEGWSGTRMTFDPPSQLYRVTAPYSGFSFDIVNHKYFIKLDSATGQARFPGYIDPNNRDGIQYDHPYERGDGNRQLNVQNGGNLTTEPFYFSSVHRYATMNNTTDTCRVTMKVNMGPATRYVDPFNPATDTLKLIFNDQMWYRAQAANQGAFLTEVRMTRQGPTDSVWTVRFKVKGRAQAGII